MKTDDFAAPVLAQPPVFDVLEPRVLLTAYYVDDAGADTNDGLSLGAPFLTIGKAAALAQPGDTVFIRSGVYRETVKPLNSGTAGAPIVFRAYNGEDVVVHGGDRLTGWTSVGGGVWKAAMPWSYTSDFQSNQVFANGRMLNLARWPSETNGDLVANPYEATVDSVSRNPSNTSQLILTDAEFTGENAARWVGSKIWINLSRAGFDGQGQTGTVVAASGNTITVSGIDTRLGNQPWSVGAGSEYFLFDPTPAALASAGGIAAAIDPGEWYRHPTTGELFIHLPDGSTPADDLVEAKRRSWGFDLDGKSHITLDGIDLFGTSLTTDLGAPTRTNTVAPAHHLIIRSMDARYVTHFTDQAGNYQMQWSSKSGLILSGSDITFRDSTIRFSAGSALSILGQRNRILNNVITDANYSVSEAGAVNFGKVYDTPGNVPQTSLDHELAYNTISNTPQQGVNFRALKNSTNSPTDIRARIHHNVIHDVMLRSYDSGALDTFGTNHQYVRIDHNVIYNIRGNTNFGIYFDFASGGVIDHNLVYDVRRPINVNWYSASDATNGSRPQNMRVYNNVALSDLPTATGISSLAPNSIGSVFQNNIVTGAMFAPTNATVSNNLSNAPSTLFTNPAQGDYSLRPDAAAAIDQGVNTPFDDALVGAPDLGALERGTTAWTAGATAAPARPAAPTGLTATSESSTRIRLDWTDNAVGEGFYAIMRSSDGGQFWTEVARVGPNATSYVDTSVAGGSYRYAVVADHRSVWSAIATAKGTSAQATFYPGLYDAQSGTLTRYGTGGTSLGGTSPNTWIKFSGIDFGQLNSVTGFWANFGTDRSGNHIYVRLDDPFNGQTVADLTTVSTGNFNNAVTQSTSVSGASGVRDVYLVFSGWGTANMNSFGFTGDAPVQAPAAPSGLAASPLSASSIRLNWVDASANESEFKIERSVDGVNFVEIAQVAAGSTAFTDTGLTPGVTYTYRVRGGNTAGDSPFTYVASATTPSANAAPTVAQPAAASPRPVTGLTTTLSVLGADDGGESGLAYTWSLLGTPPAGVTFSANGTNAAKSTTATFAKAGVYTFLVTISDGSLTTTSQVEVTVSQTLTSLSVAPATVTGTTGSTVQLAAQGRDQFGDLMATPPAVTWSIFSGGGSVSSSGLLTLPSLVGSAVVRATAGGLTASTQVQATLPAPWLPTDVGAVAAPGIAGAVGGTWTVGGAGVGLRTAAGADAFRFVYRSLTGDGSIVARVATFSGGSPVQAGITIRESLGNAARHASIVVDSSGTASFIRRTKTGGAASTTSVSASTPRWLKLTRTGSTVVASLSTDGVTWSRVGSVRVSMASTVRIGMTVGGGTAASPARATFDGVQVVGPASSTTTRLSRVSRVAKLSAASSSLTDGREDVLGSMPHVLAIASEPSVRA